MEEAFAKLSEELSNTTLEYGEVIHKVRMDLEEPVFDHLRATYGAFYRTFWENTSFAKEAKQTVLLVERREHPNIEFVLQNVMYYCSQSEQPFSLTIVCSDANVDYVKGVLGNHVETTQIIPYFKGIGTRDEGRNEYNAAFKSAAFWNQINAEYILSIQTDCYLLQPIPPVFWTYEYIACSWSWNPNCVGGGGLTWRKKDTVLHIIEAMQGKEGFEGEDCFFSEGCALVNAKSPGFEEAMSYFVESCFTETKPIGVHQWWTYWFPMQEDPEYKKQLLDLYTIL